MARDVYFDPFGSYTQGYDKGTERQMQVETNRRAARDSDFNYNYMKPLEYNSALRDDAFGQYAVPGRRQLFDNSVAASGNDLYNANLGIADRFATDTGAFQPALNMQLQRFGISASPGQAIAQTAAPGAPQYNAPAPVARPQQQNVGAIFADAITRMGRPVTPQEAQYLAQRIGTDYGLSPEQMQAAIHAHNTGAQGEPYPGAYAPAPADATAQYNIAPPQSAPPQMGPQPGTVFRDAQGNIVSVVPNIQEQYLGRRLRPEFVQDRQFQYDARNEQFNQQRQIEQLKHDNEYNRLLHEQNMRNGAGTGTINGVSWF